MSDVCRQAKETLRQRVLAERDRLSPKERATYSAAILERFLALPEVTAATTVMTFVTFRSEVDTLALIDRLLAAGKTVAVPKVLAPREMACFRLRDRQRELVAGAWDIPEPCADLECVDPQTIDLVVVPGSVFATDGSRMGYGGGFYDTYLCGVRPQTPLVGLAFELQIVPELPCEAHDLPVDAIVTEDRVIRPTSA